MAIATNGLQIVRIAGAVFNQQLSAADYSEILTANKTAAELNAWANSAVAAEFKGKTTLDISKAVLANLGLTVTGLDAWLAGQLTAGGGVAKAGETMLGLLNDFSNMTADVTFGASASTFNTKAAGSQALSQTAGTATGTYAAVSTANAALTLTSATQTSTGTAGDDTFTAAAGTWGVGDIVNGGTGTDTLNATVTGTGPTQSATSLVGVEVLNVTASPNPATLDLTGVTGLTQVNNTSSANGATLSVTGLGNVVNTTITGGNTSTSIAYATAATAGLTDAATVSLKGAAAGSGFTTSGIETLTINSGTSANTLATLSAVGMSKLVVTGDQALTIGGTTGNSGATGVVGTTTFDLSAATGALTLSTGTGTGGTGSVVGVTVTGPTAATAGALTLTTSSLNDTVTLGANANTVDTGALNDTITSGGGANTITPGTGNDTINAGAGVDTIRFAEAGATTADTINAFGATDVIAINIGAAAVTGASAKIASAITAFGVVPTGATSPVLQNVAGTATTNAVVFQTVAPATATANTIALASNVVSLNGVYTDGTVGGVTTALGSTGVAGVTTSAAGRFLLVTYSVGNTAQVWSYGGDGSGTGTLNSDIDSGELSLVATLNGVALNGLTAANFSTYLTPVAATTTVSNAGQTINLTGTANTVLSTANTAGQFLTAGADTINVGVGTLPNTVAGVTTGSLTIIDPATAEADVLNATVLGDWAAGSVISGIETINLNMLVAGTTFSASARTPGTTTFGLTGTQNFTVTALPNAGAITLGLDYAGTASAALVSESGTADSLTVNLSGNAKASNLVYVGTALEKADVNVTAASSILMNGTDLFGAAGNVDATKLAGSGSLTVYGSGTNLGSLNLNGSDVGYTGSLTLRPSASAAMDFSTNTADAGLVTGIKTIDLQDTTGWTGAITLAGANSTTNAAVTVSFAPTTLSGNTTIGAVTISQVGGGLSDAVTLSMGANALSVGALTMNSIETVTINSSRVAANTFTVGNITLDDAVGTQKITITSASTVALGSATFTADTVDMVGVTGATTGTLTLANTGGVLFTGPTGAISVVGSAVADNITTGAGNDTVSGKAGADVINVGSGTDTVIFAASSTAAAAGTNTSADTITGITFGTGGDVLTISITAQATAFLLSNGNNGAVTDGVTPVVQHALTATATAFGATTNVLVLDAIYANAAAVKTAIEAGGSTALTQATAFTAASDFLLIWSDGTNGHVTFVNDTNADASRALAATEATLTEVATLIGVTSVAGAVAANFAFIA